jgi:hypothetical protein
MRRFLDLVDKCDRIVGKRNAAALVIAEKGIFAEAEFAGALAGHEQCRRRQKRPVKLFFAFQSVQKIGALKCFCLVGRWKVRLVYQGFAWCDLEAPGAADYEITLRSGCARRVAALATPGEALAPPASQ